MTDTSRAPRSSSGGVPGTNTCGRSELSSDAVDAVFDLLSNHRRRHALSYLAGRDEAVTLDELARELARREGTVHEAACQQVMTALHHTHLPKLADAGFLEYDERSRTVVPADQPPLLETCLTSATKWERP